MIIRLGLLSVVVALPIISGFVARSSTTTVRQIRCNQRQQQQVRIQTTPLALLEEDDKSEDSSVWLGQEEIGTSDSLYDSLSRRQDELRRGIGRRYLVVTQKGFLNVHSSCTHADGPFAIDNIVGRLQDGQIVTSVSPPVDEWIEHDQGGWSVGEFMGHRFLVPLSD